MRVKFDYAVRSKIEVEDGTWPPMTFERGKTQFQVEKPIPKMDWYIAFGGSGSLDGGVGVNLTVLSVQAESADSVAEDDFVRPFLDRIEAIRNELVAWIRAATRQYWVGYRESDFLSEQMNFMLLAGEHERSTKGGSGRGFKYGRPLTANDWKIVGEQLAQNRRAPLHLSLFCDGLLDIAEGDMMQAAFTLGISCEVGVYLAVRRLLETKCPPLLGMLDNKYLQYRFDALLELPSELEVTPFSTFDKEAASRVKELHDSRNAALHQGKSLINRKGAQIPLDRDTVKEYLDAIEKLFVWCDSI